MRGFVRPSVGPSVRQFVSEHKSKSGKTSILEALGGALVEDGGWLPLPTRPQRYCDPTSLVFRWENVFFLGYYTNEV